MILTHKILTIPEGFTATGSASLIGATLLKVKREGTGFKQTLGVPGNREYSFSITFGAVLFDTPAAPGGEKVYVLYKTY